MRLKRERRSYQKLLPRDPTAALLGWLTICSIAPSIAGAPTQSPKAADSFRKLKYENLLKYTENLDQIIVKTVEEFRTLSLHGYNSSDDQKIFYKLTYNFNLTESERYIDQIQTLRAFFIPLANAMKELKKSTSKHAYNDVKLIRYQTINIALTINYVAKHLGYSIPKYDRRKAKQQSHLLFPSIASRSLGNRVVSLIQCLQDQLLFIRYFYEKSIRQRMVAF